MLQKISTEIDTYFNNPEFPIEKTVCFCFAKESLIKESYHYLLFGSEALLPVADNLKKSIDINFRKRLIETGNHYLIQVKIAIKDIECFWFENIYDYLINNSIESGFKIYKNLEPNFIIKFEQTERPDDLQNLVNI